MNMLRATYSASRLSTRLLPMITPCVYHDARLSRFTVTRFAPDAASAVSVDKLIIQDHDKARKLFSEYDRVKSDEKQLVAYHIIREVSMHSAKEEEVIYPVIARVFGEGEREHLLEEHQVLKDNLDTLSGMNRAENEKAFDHLLHMVRTAFEHHIKEEEEQEIPKLLKAPGVDGMELGKQFQNAAAHAPTRPHPLAPNKPPANIAAHIATAPLDKAADAVRFKIQTM